MGLRDYNLQATHPTKGKLSPIKEKEGCHTWTPTSLFWVPLHHELDLEPVMLQPKDLAFTPTPMQTPRISEH